MLDWFNEWQLKKGRPRIERYLYSRVGKQEHEHTFSVYETMLKQVPVLALIEQEWAMASMKTRRNFLFAGILWHMRDHPTPGNPAMQAEAPHQHQVAEMQVNAKSRVITTNLDKEVRNLLGANKWDHVSFDFANLGLNEVATWQKVRVNDTRNHCWLQALYALLTLGISDSALNIAHQIYQGRVFTKDQQLELTRTTVKTGTGHQILDMWYKLKNNKFEFPTYSDMGFPAETFNFRNKGVDKKDEPQAIEAPIETAPVAKPAPAKAQNKFQP